MNIGNTDLVTLDNGSRPAGKPDECFYCGNKIGETHKDDCVLLKKTVVVKLTADLVIKVPRSWDSGNVNFKYNGSSHCNSNIIHSLEEYARDENKQCLCGLVNVVYEREASEADHQDFPVLD